MLTARFWQIPLARNSSHLTTFITPFQRYYFHRLPFGITSTPELFQRRISSLLNGLSGVVFLIDDVLVFSKNQAQHDEHLEVVSKRIILTLNSDKCEFLKAQLKFLGHIVSQHGLQADPEKTRTILNM